MHFVKAVNKKYLNAMTRNSSKSKVYCSVYGCTSKKSRNPELTFHHFPTKGKTFVDFETKRGTIEKIDLRVLWTRKLKMGKPVTPSMRICSLHFLATDYIIPTCIDRDHRYLKPNSVPSVNLPQSSIDKFNHCTTEDSQLSLIHEQYEKLKDEEKQLEAENFEKLHSVPEHENLPSSPMQEQTKDICEHYLAGDDEKSPQKMSSQDSCDSNHKPDEPEMNETGCAGTIIEMHFSGTLYNFSESLKTDSHLSTATGIPNFILFDGIVQAVELVVPNLKSRGTVLSIRDRCLMTFVKLKQNLSYSFLCLLFPTVTLRHCSEVINNMLDILCEILKPFIHFPSLEEISRSMPLCFSDYTNTQIVLDCTEIKMQCPKNLCCQIATFSNYKSTYTIKFMTGVSPGGLISYVSKAYGGRASDKAIFTQSHLIERMDKRAAVMVDKGFLIDDICLENKIKLYRPPFLGDQQQFSDVDAQECCNIASARVHVERLNQRLKVFLILGGVITSCLVPKIEKIMIITSAIVNLSNPIFKDDKFFK